VSAEDARSFVHAWYTPKNATLAIAGHFDPRVAMGLVERYFGTLVGAEPPARKALPPAWSTHDGRLDAAAPVVGDAVRISWLAPRKGERDDLALDLAASILADPTGRLQHELVRSGLVRSVTARERSFFRGSAFEIEAGLVPGKSPDDVLAAVERVIDAMRGSVGQEECERARREWHDKGLLRLESSAARAKYLVGALATEGTWGLGKYDGIEASDVMHALQAILVPSRRAVVVLHHDRHAPPGGTVSKREEHGQ
jgi:zinc protease